MIRRFVSQFARSARPFSLLLLLILGASLPIHAQSEANGRIIRFDQQLHRALESGSTDSLRQLAACYPQYTAIYCEGVVNRSLNDLSAFFSNKELRSLYLDAMNRFADLYMLEKEIYDAFDRLKSIGVTASIPQLYTHVSGMNQSIVVGERFLSISIDKYMGVDYPMYKKYLPDYQIRQMVREKIAADCVRAWLYSEYPFRAGDKSLREYMLYEGRVMGLLTQIFPESEWRIAMGYTQHEWAWANNNVKNLWDYFNKHSLLANQDPSLIARYINEAPRSTFIAPDAPDRLGIFLGWIIAEKYRAVTLPKTIEEWMSTDAKTILSKVSASL